MINYTYKYINVVQTPQPHGRISARSKSTLPCVKSSNLAHWTGYLMMEVPD